MNYLPSLFVRTVFYSLCALCVMVPQAKADTQAIRNSNSEVWGALGSSFLNYKEPSIAPDLPDSQHGQLPSIAGGVSYMGATSNWLLAAEGAVAFGSDHYQGSYLFSGLPVGKNTNQTIVTLDGKVGRAFELGSYVMVTPYIELGSRYWKRNLGDGQVEEYNNLHGLGGLMLQVAPTDRLVFTGYGSAGSTIAPQMKADGMTFKLVDQAMYKVGAKIGYTFTQRWELFGTFDYDHFRYGKSPVNSFGYYEPNSRTEDTTARLGLGYHFR